MRRGNDHPSSGLRHMGLTVALTLGAGTLAAAETPAPLARQAGAEPLNVVFILTDDHRYDAMGFMGHPFLETPHMDALAEEGVHFRNAFVTTSLCSPSRASILTGLYAHRHHVVDNNHPVPAGTVYFPQYLQQAGYETAFVGKWHMGNEGDDPKPGFDHWVSFRGQGTYLPSPNGLNVNGERVPQKGYITDELTDYAVDWLEGLSDDQPFFLYLSHKAVHANFTPAERHAGRYADREIEPPSTMALPARSAHWPAWTQNQRNSWHGVDFPYHSRLDVWAYYRRYLETLLGVDDSVGRVVDHLRRRGWLDNTLVMYMGDNGFAFGEHGLIDKRTAYEESMRVPDDGPGSGRAGRNGDRERGGQHRRGPHRARGRGPGPARGPRRPEHAAPAASELMRPGAPSFSTSTSGSATSPRPPRCTPSAGTGTSTSATTASGTWTSSSTSRRTRPSPATSSPAPSTRRS